MSAVTSASWACPAPAASSRISANTRRIGWAADAGAIGAHAEGIVRIMGAVSAGNAGNVIASDRVNDTDAGTDCG